MSAKADIAGLFGWPLGLQRLQAAAYIGVSGDTFDKMVDDGRMPPSKRLSDETYRWDRRGLDTAFAALPDRGGREAQAGVGDAEGWETRP